MVDVVGNAYAASNAVKVVDGSHNIVNDNMLRNKVVGTVSHFLTKCVLIVAALIENFLKNGEANFLVDADFLKLVLSEHRNILADVNHTV